jgi:hypothetical protein
LKARLRYVALLLVSITMTLVVASLWLTEPSLPRRTQVAFGVLTLIGLSWIALATWVLSARRPLFARDRVIAGRMAVAFTSMFVLGAGFAVAIAGNVASLAVLALSSVMLALALKRLASARLEFAAMLARKAELEQRA